MINMLIVEDQKLLQDSLTNTFESTGDFKVVATLSDSNKILASLQKNNVEIILSDICTAEGHNVFDDIPAIKAKYPKIKIILITAFPEVSFIKRAKLLKVDSFVYKNIPTSDLISIVKNTALNYSSYPNENILDDEMFKSLTLQESEVLRLFCTGKDRKEIAKAMSLSESTIKNYITNILAKTRFSSMAKLALYSVKNGYIL